MIQLFCAFIDMLKNRDFITIKFSQWFLVEYIGREYILLEVSTLPRSYQDSAVSLVVCLSLFLIAC